MPINKKEFSYKKPDIGLYKHDYYTHIIPSHKLGGNNYLYPIGVIDGIEVNREEWHEEETVAVKWYKNGKLE